MLGLFFEIYYKNFITGYLFKFAELGEEEKNSKGQHP